MFRFFWLTLVANFGMEAVEALTHHGLNFDGHQTVTALGIAAFVKYCDAVKKGKKAQVVEEVEEETTPQIQLEGHLLHRYEGLKEIAEQERVSLNGLFMSCNRVEKEDQTLYNLHFENRPEPFVQLVYDVKTNDVSISKMSYLRKYEGISPIMNKIINKVYLLEKNARGIEIPTQISSFEEQEKGLESTHLEAKEETYDDIQLQAHTLIDKLKELASNEQYLDIVEVHKLSNTYKEDIERTLALYNSFNDDMKEKSKPHFIMVLEQIETNLKQIKDAIQNRQEHELKRLLNLMEKRND